ncbi:MAG: recombinase family protein [Sterolibacteriaceae bacterium MAG5]|nr:recombinase family protein [Candidatus Nitricoxidireducens bremensis]
MQDKHPQLTESDSHAGTYVRYSDTDQRETSIDDQIRRCREIAARHGATIPDALVFSDSAITGADKARHKRVGFDQLIAAMEAGKFSLLIVDELCRLARNALELLKFNELLKKHNVRLITADGLDSTSPTWPLQLSIMGGMAQFALEEIRHRVERTLEGQLVRGWMVAPPPYGYRTVPEVDGNGKALGSRWEIVEAQADVVRQIFKWRADGKSFAQIAKALNARGIAPKPRNRKHKRTETQMWLPAGICRMLSNPIYKGIFVFHGSTTYRKRMAAVRKTVTPKEFPRPQLAIVSEDLWALCNGNKISRSGYGGGRHEFAGLLTCGQCHGTLTVTSPGKRTRSLTCASCNQEKMSGIRDSTPGYASVSGIAFLLQSLIESGLGKEMREQFRLRLRERLAGGRVAELAEAREALVKAERICKRLADMLGQIAEDDPYLVAQFEKARQARLAAEQTVKRLEDVAMHIDTEALEAQLAVDPAAILKLLFTEDAVPVERKRAVLSRLFPRIVMIGKRAPNETVFDIDMIPGAMSAELTGTGVLVDDLVRRRVVLKTSARRPTVWEVEDITETIGEQALAA